MMKTNTRTRVLVLGAGGMLGSAMLRLFSETADIVLYGSARRDIAIKHLPATLQSHVITGVDVSNVDQLSALLEQSKPDVMINCIGLVKQLSEADDPLEAIPINSLLPHRLARMALHFGARLVHISTDCVFSGMRGGYMESDFPDALDLYGRSKLLGEVAYPNSITLRTSIIGPELVSAHGLLGWFLSQQGPVHGYTKAIFSGLPTGELARVVRDHVIPNPALCGVYHVSSSPISKYDLLTLIDSEYERKMKIIPDDRLTIDRSLNSDRFKKQTGYQPPAWPELVHAMRIFS